MKYFVVLALCLSAAVADFPPTDLHARVDSIRDIHYSQHSQTVGDAKRIVNERLGGAYTSGSDAGQQQILQSSLEDVDSYGVGTVGASGLSSRGSSSSYNSASSSSQSDNQQVLQDEYFNGGGGAGSSSSFNTEYGSSQNAGAGPIVIPVSGGAGGSESFSEQSERRVEGGSSPSVIVSAPVGGSESYSRHHESRVQKQAAPIYVSGPAGGSESYSHHEERRVQNQAAPVYVAPSGGSESYSHHEERRVQNQAAPVYVAPAGGSESYSHHEERRVQNQAAPVYVAPSGGSESYSHHEERRVQNQAAPVYVAPAVGGSESFSHQEERRVQNQAAPLYISSPSGGSESYTHHREQRIQQAAIPTVFTPSGASESYTHHRQQRIQSQPSIIYTSPSGTSESYSHRSEKVVKAQPVPLYIAPSTGSESYSQMRKFSSQSQAAPITIVPSVGLSSHSSLLNSHSQSLPGVTYYPNENSYSSRLSENILNSQIAPTYSTIITPGGGGSEYSYTHKSSKSQARPSVIYTSPALNSHSSYISSQSSRNAGSSYPIVTGLGASGTLVDANSLYTTNGLNGALIVPSSSTYGSHSSLFDSGLHSSSNLGRYMTESERLARVQAQDVGFGGFRTGSSQLNLDGSNSFSDLGSGNLHVGDGRVGGGYRTKSWEKSSKWASGSQYGSDGKPNNYNLLSTAESENHDINGRQAGYKAATTTLDDNGKVSTYSIHS